MKSITLIVLFVQFAAPLFTVIGAAIGGTIYAVGNAQTNKKLSANNGNPADKISEYAGLNIYINPEIASAVQAKVQLEINTYLNDNVRKTALLTKLKADARSEDLNIITKDLFYQFAQFYVFRAAVDMSGIAYSVFTMQQAQTPGGSPIRGGAEGVKDSLLNSFTYTGLRSDCDAIYDLAKSGGAAATVQGQEATELQSLNDAINAEIQKQKDNFTNGHTRFATHDQMKYYFYNYIKNHVNANIKNYSYLQFDYTNGGDCVLNDAERLALKGLNFLGSNPNPYYPVTPSNEQPNP